MWTTEHSIETKVKLETIWRRQDRLRTYQLLSRSTIAAIRSSTISARAPATSP